MEPEVAPTTTTPNPVPAAAVVAAPVASTAAPAAAVSPAPTPVARPTPTPSPTPSQTPAPVDTMVRLPSSTYETLMSERAELARYRAEQEAARQEVARKEALLLSQRGEHENAIQRMKEENDTRLKRVQEERDAVESSAKHYALTGELAQTLAAQKLNPGATEILTKLWMDQFVAERSGNTFVVHTPTHQSVKEFVSTQLAKPEYSIFLAPTTTGGVGNNTATSQATPTPSPNPVTEPVPPNFGQAIYAHFKNRQTANAVDGRTVDGRAGVLPGFGLPGTRVG